MNQLPSPDRRNRMEQFREERSIEGDLVTRNVNHYDSK